MPEHPPKQRRRPVPLLPVANRGSVLQTGVVGLRACLAEVIEGIEAVESLSPQLPLRHRSNLFDVGGTRICVLAMDPARWRAGPQSAPSLIIPFRGRLRVTAAGREYTATGGRTAVLCGGVPFVAETGALSALMMTLDDAHLRAAGQDPDGAPSSDLHANETRQLPFSFVQELDEVPALHRLLEEIGRAIKQPDLASLLGLEGLLHRWIAALLQATPPRERRRRLREDMGDEPPLARICRHIEEHLAEPLRLIDIERVGGISRRALQYAFRREYGCTPSQWILERRLARAHALLSEAPKGETVTSIALDLGFSQLGVFSRRFTARYGKWPSEVLAAARNEDSQQDATDSMKDA